MKNKLILLFLLSSCAGIKPISQNAEKKGFKTYCKEYYQDTEKRHLVMAAKIKSSVLANCFRNYLKFEKNKKQSISTCNQLNIKKNGRVSYVQVTNTNRKHLPKDFKMCVVQEYRTMDFNGLQLEKNHLIKFQLNFSSI